MPLGWLSGRHGPITTIPSDEASLEHFETVGKLLKSFFAGRPDPFTGWVCDRTSAQAHPFEMAVREMDLEAVTTFAKRQDSVGLRL
jgi:hypothetical protein